MTDRDLDAVAAEILAARGRVPAARSALVAITGIDGCGKGFVTARTVLALTALGVRAVALNIDGWLNLPAVRFSETDPAEHFYRNAIRFDQLFAELVFPLRDNRSIHIEADHAEETATSYRKKRYEIDEVDVVVLEGIYLLKRAFQTYYDLSVWIDCTFATALDRALARGQEGLPPAATIAAYRRIYFPAQAIHLERDDPRRASTTRIDNDPRLGPAPPRGGR